MASPSEASNAGVAMLLHPRALVQRVCQSATALAALVCWGSTTFWLVCAYVPPLTDPHRIWLEELGQPATEKATLHDLESILEALSPSEVPVLLLGDLSTQTASTAPDLPH